MKIQIDTELLTSQGLTLDEYFVLKSLYDKNYNEMLNVYTSSLSNTLVSSLIKGLEINGWLKNMNDTIVNVSDFDNVILKPKAKNLFFNDKSFFNTFWATYPIKVGVGNNIRVLKSKDSNTLQAIDCKKKLEIITKRDPQIEALILKGLNNELLLRKRTNTMNFFQLVETYLNQRTWEKYVDLDEEESNTSEVSI